MDNNANIHDKVRDGHYFSVLPYGGKGSPARDHYYADQARLKAKFRADLIEEYGTEVLPKEVENAMFAKAWEDGDGFYGAVGHYEELATLVLLAFNAGIKQGK